MFFVVLHDEGYDLKGLIFHSLDIEVYFGPDLMFGGSVFFGGVGVGVMGWASVATCNDGSSAGFLLEVVK